MNRGSATLVRPGNAQSLLHLVVSGYRYSRRLAGTQVNGDTVRDLMINRRKHALAVGS